MTPSRFLNAVIPAGQSVSNWLDLRDARVVGFGMPAVWTAAGLSFDVSFDGGTTFRALYDAGTERTRAADVGRYIAELIESWLGIRWIRVRSGTVGAPVAQVAAATIVINTDTY